MPRYATLSDLLASDGTRQQVTADAMALIEQQVGAASGLSGAALKAAHKAVTTVAPGYYESRVQILVPILVGQLQPFWTEFHSAPGGGSFGDFLAARAPQVSDAVLAVTDGRAKVSNRTAVTKIYQAVRGSAVEHIQAALPALGALVEKHAA